MAKSWYPPVLFPIPKGHYSHYQTISTTDQLYNLLRKHRIFNDEKPPKTTWFRLFKRRASDKTPKSKRHAPYYAIYNSTRELIRVERTKKAALAILQKSAVYRNVHIDPFDEKEELEIGSHIVKAQFNDDVDYHDIQHPVAVKRCDACPNKTSKQGACACGFWSAIRDSTQSWIWWSPQEHKEYIKRAQKKQVVEVKLSLFDKLVAKK
jgi:hypothetical protein